MKRFLAGAGLFLHALPVLAGGTPPPTDMSVDTRSCKVTPFSAKFTPPTSNRWADPDTIRKLRDLDARIPFEISRIREGVVSYTVGVVLGGGPLFQYWYAVDFERSIFVSVLAESQEKKPAGPTTPLAENQLYRHISADGPLKRAETVTVFAATRQQARQFKCLASRVFHHPDRIASSKVDHMPSADASTDIQVFLRGRPLQLGQRLEVLRATGEELRRVFYPDDPEG